VARLRQPADSPRRPSAGDGTVHLCGRPFGGRGGSRSDLWRQIQADVFNTELVTITIDEGPAFGVALLAAVGAGMFSSVEEACAKTIKLKDRTQPVSANVATYELFYRIYRSLYPALKPLFADLSKAVC
jgi:xylulokinase